MRITDVCAQLQRYLRRIERVTVPLDDNIVLACFSHIATDLPVYPEAPYLDADLASASLMSMPVPQLSRRPEIHHSHIRAKPDYAFRGNGKGVRGLRRDGLLLSLTHSESATSARRPWSDFEVAELHLLFGFTWRGRPLRLALVHAFTKVRGLPACAMPSELAQLHGGRYHPVLRQPVVKRALHADRSMMLKVVDARAIYRNAHLHVLHGSDVPPATADFRDYALQHDGPFVVSLLSDEHIFRMLYYAPNEEPGVF
jgi:hypothetical protein